MAIKGNGNGQGLGWLRLKKGMPSRHSLFVE